MPLNMFIDTSVFLSFFAISDDDIEQLRKLVRLIKDDEVRILINAQVFRELRRNRDNKLATALNEFAKSTYKLPTVPRFMQGYEEIATIREALALAESAHKSAIQKARKEAEQLLTNADELIEQIFEAAGIKDFSAEVYDRAIKRMYLGDPPGKEASLGDRINWEHLLNFDGIIGDLHIITRDNDYRSPLQNNLPNFALRREWMEHKQGELYVHREIRNFLSSKFSNFDFKAPARLVGKVISNEKLEEYEAALEHSRWLEAFQASLIRMTDTSSLEDFHLSINFFLDNSDNLSTKDHVSICGAAANNSRLQDFSDDGQVQAFFISSVLRTHHMLEKDVRENLTHGLGIDFGDDDFEQIDPLMPDYEQLYIDNVEENG